MHLGPRAQAVLRAFLKPDVTAYLFDPREAEADRSAERRRNRKSRMTPSQAKRKRKARPKRAPRDHYTKDSYARAVARAVARACEKAKVPRWHPHQLRHTAATKLRREYGLEAAQVVLGHRTAVVTQIYAQRDQAKAEEIMARIG